MLGAGHAANGLISKQSVLFFWPVGAYLRIDSVDADPPGQSWLCGECSDENEGLKSRFGESPHKRDAGQILAASPVP